MRSKLIALSLCAIFSLGTVVGAAVPKPVKQLQYKVKMQSASFGDMGTRKLWIKGDYFRWESYSGRLPLWLIKNKQGLFLVNPFRKIAAKYPDKTKRGDFMTLLPGPVGPTMEFLKSVKAVKHGQKTLNKQLCIGYSYTEPTTKIDCQLWIGAKSKKPVQLVMGSVKKGIDTVTATYVEYIEKAKISDSRFALPKGYPVKPMPTRKLTSEKANKQSGIKKSG